MYILESKNFRKSLRGGSERPKSFLKGDGHNQKMINALFYKKGIRSF